MWRTVVLPLLLLLGGLALPQAIRNPKLSQEDLAAATSVSKESGGADAELIYVNRIDAVEKGNFDSLVVVYAKAVEGGKDYFALVARGGQNYPLKFDQQGRALGRGDQFLKIGLRHGEGHPPLLRLIGLASDPNSTGKQRNVDFQFSNGQFVLTAQSLVTPAQ